MLTLPIETGSAATMVVDRPAYRPYRAMVVGIRSLSEHFTRVTFFGTQFDTFGTAGLDQRIKIVLPLPGRGLAEIGATDERTIADGTWYARWRALPDADRNPFRTYTIRAVRPEQREIDVDFVTHAGHGPLGPAARWLQTASVGSDVLIVGPDERSPDRAVGLDWHPAQATELLLVGDETAAPAVCSILESLPAGRRARAFIEVPSPADALPLALPAGCEITWLARDRAPHGERLDQAVREWVAANRPLVDTAVATTPQPLAEVDVDCDLLWESPNAAAGTGFYAWLAGESCMIKLLRRFLVSETGIDRSRVAFMGYWRLGRSEAQ
ncbi:siderophore-interacting protein [Cryobacterium luteum]|uniref:Siderophore-interacting protein n=1 Tax=Cryobacterium luteum TaxID=1424661 RepID=A0A1H8J229_9MICO|nr:siderophore-interacting protein [Cryobacterium luteum]TFB93288.1 siderophore-interacting protein [Cryobacterium luteum]SEN74772.1 NADPH-dependent ferric siderophore reductase, contains FAD-binding and SIP domains [Cryobacterium luteum]